MGVDLGDPDLGDHFVVILCRGHGGDLMRKDVQNEFCLYWMRNAGFL